MLEKGVTIPAAYHSKVERHFNLCLTLGIVPPLQMYSA